MKKRLLSLLLAIVMVIGLVPAMVIGVAAEAEVSLGNVSGVLPEGYFPVEKLYIPDYAEAGPCIDTKINIANLNAVTMTVTAEFYSTISIKARNLAGVVNVDNCFLMGFTSVADGFKARAWVGTDVKFIDTAEIDYEKVHTYELSADETGESKIYSFSVDNEVLSSGNYAKSIKSINRNIFIGTLNNGNVGTGRNYWAPHASIYEAIISGENGTELWHGYPCVELSTGVFGMYDTVSNMFFPSSNQNYAFSSDGAFTCEAGFSPAHAALPEGYTSIPYVKTNGYQFFDTGVKPTRFERMELGIFAEKRYDNDGCVIFSAKDWKNQFSVNFDDRPNVKGLYFWTDVNLTQGGDEALDLARQNISVQLNDPADVYIFDRQYGFSSSSTYITTQAATDAVDNTLAFFCVHNPDGYGKPFNVGSARLYYCRMYDGDDLQRYFVPCLNQEGVAGLYDLVEGKFYRSEGTLDFIAGSWHTENIHVETELTPAVNASTGKYEPVISVKYDGVPLEEETDYTLTYVGNDRPGFGSAVIEGVGNYKDQYVLYFENYASDGEALTVAENPYVIGTGASTVYTDIRGGIVTNSQGDPVNGEWINVRSILVNKNAAGFEAVFVPEDLSTYKCVFSDVDIVDTRLFYQYGASDDMRIVSVEKDGNWLLVLPAGADPTDMTGKLSLPAGAVLTAEDAGVSLTVGSDDLDLTVLFGEITDGYMYPLIYTLPEEPDVNYIVDLIFAPDVLPSFYIDISAPFSKLNDSKSNVSAGRAVMQYADGTIFNEEDDAGSLTATEVGARGNSSFGSANGGKFSYKIKFDKKYALAQNVKGEDVKSKNWVLVANNFTTSQDSTGFANAVGYDNYQNMDGDGAVSYRFVNLYLNGEYNGVYQLAEKSTTESKKLVTLDESQTLAKDNTTPVNDTNATFANGTVNGITYRYCSAAASSEPTGFVLELENSTSTENTFVRTKRGKVYSVKDPDYPTKDQMEKLAIWLQGFEDALFSENGINTEGKTISDYADLESLATQFITTTFQAGGDYWALSTYLAVDCDGEGNMLPIKAGNVWDMNGMRATTDVVVNTVWTTETYKPQFMKNGEFVSALYDVVPRFTTLLQPEYNKISAMYEDMKSTMKINQILWNKNFDVLGADFLSAFDSRITNWTSSWSDETNALRGVTVANMGGTLTATAPGATGYQWYKVGEDGYTGAEIDGETSASYKPAEEGTYYVVATGTALAGNACSDTMYSNPVEFTLNPADPKLSGSNVKKSLSPLENININIKVVNDATNNNISQYTDFVLVVEDSEGNEVKRVADWKWQGNTRYWCALPVLPQDINTVYNIHIEAKNELGEDVHGETFQYGVCTYCDNQIAKELGNGITQELKDLCTSIKAYGAAAKAYFDTLN